MKVIQPQILHLGVFLLLAISRAVYGQASCNTRNVKDSGFNGQVKSVLTQYREENGSTAAPFARILFDPSGRLLEDAHVYHRGRYQIFRYIYSRTGRDYEIDAFTASSLNQHARRRDLQHHRIRFDTQGRCVEEQDIDTDGQISDRTVYEYPDPHSIRQIDFTFDGAVSAILDRKFDASQHLILEKATEGRGSAWSREYRYDKDGRQTDIFSYRNGIPEAHWISIYDDLHRLASQQLIVADPQKEQHVYATCGDCGLTSGRTTFRYDARGRLKEKSLFDSGGKLLSVINYDHDDHGTITRELQSGTASNVPISTFTYDSKDNWTHQLTANGKRIADRIIEYY